MISGLFHIKINSSETNMDNGFFVLMNSGTSVTCLKDEEYIITKEALDKLKLEGIEYEPIVKKDDCCGEGEKIEDAPAT